MKQSYTDIIQVAAPKQPQWWDEEGVPRFCEPHPSHLNCIYARQACFFYIRCQACRTEFLVALSGGIFNSDLHGQLLDHRIHYGDPPNSGCCTAGPTMNSEPLKVHSFWYMPSDQKHPRFMEWIEVEELRGKEINRE